jgi:SWI/SNF-related matrix-associated actin-dependent regulator 1 of chromatin subfamily A
MKLKKTDSGWYVLECEYEDRVTPKRAGFWWNPKACPKQWATKEIEKAYLLRDYAFDELRAELESGMKSKVERIEASRATTADIEIARPDGLDYLPFQKAGIAYALERENTLIADEMGLGKTIQGLGIVNDIHPCNVLVICPASLRLNWIIEAKKWLVHDYEIHEVENKKTVPESATFIVTSYERLDAPGLDRDFDLAIVDECQKCKNPKAKRTKRALGFYDRDTKTEVPGLVDRAKRKVFLTGTPILNRPIEMWPVVHKCDPKNFGSFFGFAKRYCGANQNGYGWDFSGASNLDELQKKLRESFMVRRLKKDVLKELPAKRRQLVVLPTNGCAKAIKQEQKAWAAHEERLEGLRVDVDLAWASGNELSYQDAVESLSQAARQAFTEISRIRHETALAKVPEFVDFAKETIDSVGKVIIFAHHLDVIQWIYEDLHGYNAVLCTGPMSVEARQVSVERFQTDDTCRVFIGTIGAAGVGLTLTAASTVLFAELDWVPGNMTQAEDRAHRIGQLNSVNIVHVVLDGSLDQQIAATLISKQEIADRALDIGAEIDLEAKAIVVPTKKENREAKPKKVREYTKEDREIALLAISELAARCDGAQDKDGFGFNRFDTNVGKSLASQSDLSDRQTWLALKITRKYRKQLEHYLGNDFKKLEKAWDKK